MKKTEWFEEWFDSPYYHILYKNRDFAEASEFIDNLIKFLKPKQGSKVLDLACGRGRHSVYLHEKSLDVTGVDLSEKNIQYAKKFEKTGLNFFVHDMREKICPSCFDFVFNLFTSFGYFNDKSDNEKTLAAINSELKPGGTFILDYLNVEFALLNLKKEEKKEIKGIEFAIKKKSESNFICKEISVKDGDNKYYFYERVEEFSLEDFQSLLSKLNFKIVNVFGDYALNDFEKNTSPRLILIAKAEK